MNAVNARRGESESVENEPLSTLLGDSNTCSTSVRVHRTCESIQVRCCAINFVKKSALAGTASVLRGAGATTGRSASRNDSAL